MAGDDIAIPRGRSEVDAVITILDMAGDCNRVGCAMAVLRVAPAVTLATFIFIYTSDNSEETSPTCLNVVTNCSFPVPNSTNGETGG